MYEPGGQALIWLLDDSPTERQYTELVLGAGFRFEHFSDGAEVVEMLAAGHPQPDLLILDWVMPSMSGVDVCAFLRAHPVTRDLPIIMVTASRVETADIVRSLEIGANDYVAKPYAPQELRARVAALLRAKQLADLAARERARLAAINELGRRMFAAAGSIPQILAELADTLSRVMCDGCAIQLLPGKTAGQMVARHRSDAAALAAISTLADPGIRAFENARHAVDSLSPVYRSYVERFGLRGLAIRAFPTFDPIQGVVTLTRDGQSQPFTADDLATIETCLEYASLAIQNATRLDAEREVLAERERVASFQQQMLGIVGHDLRTPLGAIAAGLDLLAGRSSDAVVTRIRNSANRIERIVDQLLDVTRARLGGGIPVRLRRVSLTPVVRAVVEELASAHPKARIQLRATEDIEGVWDPDRLSQVISNLASNAIQYGRPDAPIVIEVAASDRLATLTVTNSVRDLPIAADRLAILFEPYQRGADSKHHATGLGLGLYIVGEIVRAHQGSITAESSSTGGTVFRVELPRTLRAEPARL